MSPIMPGMKAHLSDGTTCTVIDVLIDPNTGEERYLVLSVNGYFGPDAVAPRSLVWHVDESVHLNLTCEEAGKLPHYDSERYCHEAGVYSRAAAARGHHHHHTQHS